MLGGLRSRRSATPSPPTAGTRPDAPSVGPSKAAFYAMASQHGAFVLVPLFVTIFFVHVSVGLGNFAFDFHYAYRPAGVRVFHGLSPYADAGAPEVSRNIAFIYPAPAALLLAPFSLLPPAAGDILFAALNGAAALAAARLAGVRDWRILGLLLTWPPVITGWQNANVTLILVLGTAALWRRRDDPVVAGVLLGALVAVKLLLWPLALWLLATRRYAALGWSIAMAAALNLMAWLVLGVHEITRYVDVLRAVTRVETGKGYSLASLAMHAGVSDSAAHAGQWLVAAALATLSVRAGQRREDARCLALSVAVVLTASPILWTHYFAFLIVPLAITRPVVGPLWFVPLAMFVCPETPPADWTRVLALLVLAGVMTAITRRPVTASRPIPLSPVAWARRPRAHLT